MGGIEVDVARDEEIEAAVAIVVDERAACAPADIVVPESGLACDVAEGAVAIVVEEDVVSPESDEEIDVAVIVIVAGADALAPAGEGDVSFFGHI